MDTYEPLSVKLVSFVVHGTMHLVLHITNSSQSHRSIVLVEQC